MSTVPNTGIGPQPDELVDAQFPTFLAMRAARRWFVSDPDKVPYYTNGVRRGQTDTSEDQAQFASYQEAQATLARCGEGWHLGFALGPDARGGNWQGIDLDDVQQNGLADIANALPGYVEMSPSGAGVHAIGYGQPFGALGSNKSGVEAYASGRYFTVTERPIRDTGPACLAAFVSQSLTPRHSAVRGSAQSTGVEVVTVDDGTKRDLRSALLSMRADDYLLWIRMGIALRELDDVGRGLWMEWSATSEKFHPKEAARKWDGFSPSDTGYAAVFAEAQRKGWLNPASSAAQHAPAASLGGFHDRMPRNFLSTATAPALDCANAPHPIAKFASDYSAAHGFDRSGVLLASIAAAAAMMPDSYTLEVKPGWRLSPRLWTVLIGKSAAGKSPTIKAATEPVKSMHAAVVAYFKASYEPDEEDRDKPPPEPALYTSDTTIEALSQKLANNPRGMLMLTEEFSSWIGSIDSSGKGEAAKNRGAWLQLYDGGPYQIDRIGRGSIQVPNWGASVLTATTPSALAEHMKHLPEDGLIQRFIPVILASRDFNADGDARRAQAYWNDCLKYLYDLPATCIQLSSEARRLFREIEAELGNIAAAMDELSPALASHIGKHSEMVARIALVFHVFESQPGATVLSAVTLQKAAALMRQVRKHSVCLYSSILGRSPSTDLARALAHSLAAADPSLQTIGRDWMTQHCRAFAKAKDDRTRREAVQLLEDLDWLNDASKKTYGGWPTKWEVNRSIFRLYAREGEHHRAQRAAVRAVFGDQSDV